MNKDHSILQEAINHVYGDRKDAYDDPRKNFAKIATIASVIARKELTPLDCVCVQVATKLARESFKHKRDNLVDATGYICIMELLQEDEKGDKLDKTKR